MPADALVPVVIFFGALIYATFGFGDALFGMPILSVIIGIKTATPLMTMNGFTLATIMFIRHYREIDWKSARRLVFASLFGIPIGIYFLKNGNEQFTKLILGIVITGVSVYNLFLKKESIRIGKNWAYAFGFIGGVLGGAFNTGGPPIVIFGTLSGWTQQQFVGTLQGYFLPNDIFILICQFVAGLLTLKVLHYYLISLPFLLVGLFFGSKLHAKIPVKKFNQYVFVLLLMIGILFIFRTLLSA
ncbi:MAG: hypothetical protein JWN78_280 [Bacteroidota bacterium]|nr:hypothetical protein [Bacteroidota bacterium]